MKRIALIAALVVTALVAIARAQSAQAVFRTPQGERSVTVVEQMGHLFIAADDVAAALGAIVTGDRAGYRFTLGEKTAGFAAESRFGAIGDELIEMPTAPIFVDTRPFVPWEFFRAVLRSVNDLDLVWDPAARVFTVQPIRRDAVDVQASVVNLEGSAKIVVQFSRPIEHTVRRDPQALVLQTKSPLRAREAQQEFPGPLLSRVTFRGNDVVIDLASPDVAGDSYVLENPFRVVIDLRLGEPGSGAGTPALPSLRPRDLPGVRTIVLDPGHGGKEVGAIGPGGLVEKDATLAICRRLQSILSSRLGARVVLTRDDDTVVPLEQRTAIANQYKADLFLSIHLNAARVAQAKGSETYFLSLDASDELAKAAAERENASASAETTSTSAPDSDLRLILWDLAQQQYLKESSRFAELVQEEMNGASGVVNRGVKQAPFKVLIGATMPAALVEVGFISNPEEEGRLASPDYQSSVAEAMARAIGRYKQEYEARLGITPSAPARVGGAAPAAPAPAAPAAPDRSGR